MLGEELVSNIHEVVDCVVEYVCLREAGHVGNGLAKRAGDGGR